MWASAIDIFAAVQVKERGERFGWVMVVQDAKDDTLVPQRG